MTVTDKLRIEQIISAVSHELRTPIAHIMGFSGSLLQPHVQWDAATIRDFVGEIHRESQRLAIVVNRLLDISNIELEDRDMDREWHEPAALVDQAVASLQELTLHHFVRVRIQPRTATIHVDGPKIQRVLTNLVENAAKYSPPGTEIWVSVTRRFNQVVFCVADQGPGIAVEDQADVFEPFYRVERRPHGTRFGLAICKGLVERHGGRIWLESEPQKGSRFWFTLPLADQETSATTADEDE